MDKKTKGRKPITCFVPECSNKAGVLFPRTAEAKKKWLESLEITDREPDGDSFVCLDHFENREAGSGQERGPKKPLPKRKIDKNVDKNKKTDKDIQSNDQDKEFKSVSNENYVEHPKQKPKPKSASHKIELTEADIDKELQKIFKSETFQEYSDNESENRVSQGTPNKENNRVSEGDVEDLMSKCRLCMENKTNLESIYDKIDEKHTIIHAMIVCLFPLKITPKDKLSKKICKKCLKSLKDFFKFRLFCLEMDKKQQIYKGIEFDYFSDDSDVDGASDQEWEEEIELPDQNIENQNSNVKKEIEVYSDENNPRNEPSIAKSSPMNRDELLKVLEGEKSSENIQTESQSSEPETYENILIDIIQDENEDTSTYKLINSDLPIIIKPLNKTKNSAKNGELTSSDLPIRIKPETESRHEENKKRKAVNPLEEEIECSRMIKTGDAEIVIMPRGIKVKMVGSEHVPEENIQKKAVDNDYASNVGTTQGVLIAYLLDSEFLEADGYIYEFRLSKEDARNLHCLSPECPGEASQKKTGDNMYSSEISLMVPHNHKPFSNKENKTLMFYNVLRRNMQKNKNYNFRTLYQDLVELDPSIKSIIPLSGVIDGLCKYCPVPEIPKFNTFDDLFDLIEEKCFYKIHFLPSGNQFYQERFECQDGSKAIVFANQEKLSYCSYSKLMYVDASFQIIKDIFPYQLVTVLVWIHGFYYPVLYAFINRPSEDIFRVIFGFLYNNLAPDLRPDEIITEYDADVYYALTETYVDSKIGGSFFSYFQNIYKATCALNLSKPLQTMLTFRNMYYMLLMLPLLPSSTIANAFYNIEGQVEESGLTTQMRPLLQFYKEEWLEKVTPEFFGVHRLDNRIFTNLVAPFKKLKNLVVTSKTRAKHPATMVTILEKLVELELFMQTSYENPSKTWARDMHVSQKRLVLKAWNDIDENPKIKLLDFEQKVLGYLKCVENQLWIWGCYGGVEGPLEINLINSAHFSYAPNDTEGGQEEEESQTEYHDITEQEAEEENCVNEEILNEEEYQEIGGQEQADQNVEGSESEAVVTDEVAGQIRKESSQFLKFK